MQGIICMWHGLLVDIPNGWVLCDGTNGTPDLREKFVRGAADGIDPGGTGGATTHWHEGVADDNYDQLDVGLDLINDDPAGDYSISGQGHDHDVVADSENHLPPYYDIAFIMKL